MGTREYIQRRIAETPQELAWQPGADEAWQREFRQRFLAAMGIGDWEPTPLNIELGETVEEDGIRRQALTYESRPGLRVNAYFLSPLGVTEPRPGVLALHGHGAGVDAIVGLKDEWYHADFALQSVRNGFPTLAIEQMSFGDRRSRDEWSSCHMDSTAALMLGETMAGWRVWDAMRGLDVLLARPEVDGRCATVGISGGGLTSLFTGAVDTRVDACVVSGYYNTYRDSILSVFHCVDNFVPGLLRLAEMPDLAGLVAPRALFVEGGTKDDIFPLDAFHAAVAQGQRIYEDQGVPERFGWEEFEGEHQFHGKGAFAFLRSYFGV